jgi:hypothetical protein
MASFTNQMVLPIYGWHNGDDEMQLTPMAIWKQETM